MKKTMIFLVFSVAVLNVFAQTKPAAKTPTKAPVKAATKPAPPPPPPPAKKPAQPAAPVLKTSADSLSYAIGMLDGNFFKSQGVDMVNPGSLAQGFADVMKDKTLFTPEQADMIVRTQMQKMSIKKILPNIEACNNFLAENAKKKLV